MSCTNLSICRPLTRGIYNHPRSRRSNVMEIMSCRRAATTTSKLWRGFSSSIRSSVDEDHLNSNRPDDDPYNLEHFRHDNGYLMDTSLIANPIREEVREYTRNLRNRNIDPPLLIGVLANDDIAAAAYAENTAKQCTEDGIRYELLRVDATQNLQSILNDLNRNDRVNGVIVYYPIYKNRFGRSQRGPLKHKLSGVYYKSQDDFIQDKISPEVDVEGLCLAHNSRGIYKDNSIYKDKTHIFPCTAMAVFRTIDYCCAFQRHGGIDLSDPQHLKFKDKTVTIINRSEIFGRPLASMLSHEGATVYSADVDSILRFRNGRTRRCRSSQTLEKCVQESDVVITGVPDPCFQLPTRWIRSDSIVINVASFKNVNEDEILTEVEDVKYVPLVGKVTVAALERNLILLYDKFHLNGRT